jgi:succinate dehydrogenase / fumarate reductase flavoprotein subunit
MYERFQGLGVNMAEAPVEVAPTAHYGMGGVVVDEFGETRIDDLFAIGETMAGVHGANRLGGNSLAETVAFGVIAGQRIAERVSESGTIPGRVLTHVAEPQLRSLVRLADRDGTHDVMAVFRDLQDLLWEHAGILRDEQSLRAGLDELDTIRKRASDLDVGPVTSDSFEFALDIGFMLTTAQAVLRGALERTESRGAHHRTDFPETDPDWQRNLYFEQADLGRMKHHTEPVRTPSDAVQDALAEGHELDYHQLE